MNARVKSALKYTFSILLTFGFLYLAFRGTDFQKLWETLEHANYWWALSALPIVLLSHALRAWRWEYFLRPLKPNLHYRNLWSATIIGYMMNNVLPRAGELVRPYALAKMEGVSRSASFGTVLVERIFDVLSFMVVLALIPLVYSGPLTTAFPWLETAGIWIAVVTFGFFGLFVFLMLRRDVVEKLLKFFTRHISPKNAKLVERITHSFLDGFEFLKETKHYFMIGLLSVLVWGLYIVMMYLPFFAFGMTEKYSLNFASAMVVQGISSIGIVMPTPGATGPYHYFTIETLTKLYGVDEDVARSYAAVTHAVGYIGVTVIGLIYFVKENLKMSEVMKQNLQTGANASGAEGEGS